MKIVITGGHFSPAYAFIEKFRDQYDFIIIGRKHAFEGDTGESFEYKVSQNEHIPFYNLKTARLQRKLTSRTIPSIFHFPAGVVNAMRILRRTKPDIILSFGGYISVPVALAARVLHIPIVIHEQTQEAGLANKMVGKFADKILLSFASSARFFSHRKTVVTGNPVRSDVFTVRKKIDIPSGVPLIYITGGSGGSHFINHIIGRVISALVKDYVVIHQTGDSHEFNDFDELTKIRKELPEDFQNRYVVRKFIFPDEIGWVMHTADLIISRSGMNTVHEILALKKKALLIPLPHGQNNEQLKNALLVKKIGLGEYINQSECEPDRLTQTISEMLANAQKYESVSVSDEFFRPDAIQNIDHELQLVYAQKIKKN